MERQHPEPISPELDVAKITTPPVDHKLSGVDWLPGNQSRVKPIQLRVGYLCLSHSPKNPLAQQSDILE
jgi:hypothetical protein